MKTMDLCDSDYYIAACLDTAYEKLDVETISAACSAARNAEEFFWAVQAGVRLKEVCDAYRR